MSRAYNKQYLSHAMRNVGVMMDCGVNKYHLPLEIFYQYFLASDVSKYIARGNPRYLTGLSGAELADLVVEQAGGTILDTNDGTYQVNDIYWVGWALAYYQWKSNRSFAHLSKRGLDAQTMNKLYNPLHEADITKFAQVADTIIQRKQS